MVLGDIQIEKMVNRIVEGLLISESKLQKTELPLKPEPGQKQHIETNSTRDTP